MSGVPPSLKAIQPFLKLSDMFLKKDKLVAYYCKLYSIQEGLPVGKTDPAAKAFLMNQMDQLSQLKKALKEDDDAKDEVVAQAHIEEFAFKLFESADNDDRAGRFHTSTYMGRLPADLSPPTQMNMRDKSAGSRPINMIKGFYTSSLIFTILKQFGPLSDEVQTRLKYAKWKAVEIDRCLKCGITPTPGPPGGDEGGEFNLGEADANSSDSSDVPPPQYPSITPSSVPTPSPDSQKPVPKPRHQADTSSAPPKLVQQPTPMPPPPQAQAKSVGSAEISRAQKLCKFASSALDYQDVTGAVDFLQKAIKLLQTGKEE